MHYGKNTHDGGDVTGAHRMAQNSEAASFSEEVTQDPEEDELTRSLADRLSGFQSRLLPDIHIEDLVFGEPSIEDPSIPPVLQSHVEMNTRYLEYRDWIIN